VQASNQEADMTDANDKPRGIIPLADNPRAMTLATTLCQAQHEYSRKADELRRQYEALSDEHVKTQHSLVAQVFEAAGVSAENHYLNCAFAPWGSAFLVPNDNAYTDSDFGKALDAGQPPTLN
jgi:hypothetical protein